MSTTFAHRLKATLLFNPYIPSSGNEIKANLNGTTQVKLKVSTAGDPFEKPDEPSWLLWQFPPSRAVRGIGTNNSVDALVRMGLESRTYSHPYFTGIGAGGSGIGRQWPQAPADLQAYAWRYRDHYFLKLYNWNILWDPSNDYIPCSSVEFYAGVTTEGYNDWTQEPPPFIETGRRTFHLVIDTDGSGSTNYTGQQWVTKPVGWMPENEGFQKVLEGERQDLGGGAFTDSGIWWKETGSNVTASMTVNTQESSVPPNHLSPSFGFRDAEVDTGYTFTNLVSRNYWNPQRGDGSPFNLDSRHGGSGKIELYLPYCMQNLCSYVGYTYTFVVSYEKFTCKAGVERSKSFLNDYEMTSTGSGQETFTYTFPPASASSPVTVATFDWSIPQNEARKITDVKLTSITPPPDA